MKLYTKYRPYDFDEVVGQEAITRSLKAQVDAGKLSGAVLLVGPRGDGKTTTARICARYLTVAEPVVMKDYGEGEVPAWSDEVVSLMTGGGSLNVRELDGARNGSVDEARALIDDTAYLPQNGAKKKVYIIDEVHMLSNGAFNALLKTLEEPPAHCVFFLCTTEEHKVPVTIKSRCQVFHLCLISEELITERLKGICEAEGIVAEDKALSAVAILAKGSMRDALSIMEKCINTCDEQGLTEALVNSICGKADQTEMYELLGAIAECDIMKALQKMEAFEKANINAAVLIDDLQGILFETQKYLVSHLEADSRVPKLAGKIVGLKKLYGLVGLLRNIKKDIRGDLSPYVFFASSVIDFIQTDERLDALEVRVTSLETSGISFSPVDDVQEEVGELREEVSEKREEDISATEGFVPISDDECPFLEPTEVAVKAETDEPPFDTEEESSEEGGGEEDGDGLDLNAFAKGFGVDLSSDAEEEGEESSGRQVASANPEPASECGSGEGSSDDGEDDIWDF